MIDGSSVHTATESRMVLFSDDAIFLRNLRGAFDANIIAGFSIVEAPLNGRLAGRECRDARIAIVDVRSPQQKNNGLSELQQFMAQVGDLPVIVVVDAFNEVVARKLVQMHVADILVKPVAPMELLRACTAVAREKSEESQIYTFLPVAGGVGTTTIAIQSAMTLLAEKAAGKRTTCLVDLNFYHGACTHYLDIEPRLNLKEIELKPERLDRQLLESMVAHHSSGLAVIATRNLPAEIITVTPNIVMGLLNVVCQCFDRIVIDMPKEWQAWTDNVVLGSNNLFVVSEASVPSAWRAKELLENISTRLGDRVRPKVIVNRFERRLFGSALRHCDFASAIGEAFAGTVPYNRKLVREAIDRGVQIGEIQNNSNIEAAIRRLVLPQSARTGTVLQSLSRPPRLEWAWRATA
jgi:pilus assembly protein CpaE